MSFPLAPLLSPDHPLIPVPSISLPNPFSHLVPSSTPLSPSSAPYSSSASSSAPTSSTFSPPFTLSLSSSSSSSPSSPFTTSPIPDPASSVVQTLQGGSTTLVTVQESSSFTPLVSNPSSFLNNKTAEGVVFTLVGIVALVLIFVVVTFTIRRRKRRLEIEEILSFNPAAVDARTNSMEKAMIRTSEGREG